MMNFKNLAKEPQELLINQGWPEVGEVDFSLCTMLVYLQDVKHEIRTAHVKAQ